MPGQVSQELIGDLVRIGTLKRRYPFRERGKFNKLGLFVQMKSLKGMTSLKAGGKFISRINLYQQREGEKWEVKKYKPGEWERLVKPTLELAEWLHKWEGMWDAPLGGAIAKLDFKEAIEGFTKTGVLKLSSTADVEYRQVSVDATRGYKTSLGLISERMQLLKGLVRSNGIFAFSGLDLGSADIKRECDALEECLWKAEKVQAPEHLGLQNATFLAMLRVGINMGWLARDCHRIWEDRGLGDVVARHSALLAKIEEFNMSVGEYSEHYREYINVIDQLIQEEENTLKRRLAARK